MSYLFQAYLFVGIAWALAVISSDAPFRHVNRWKLVARMLSFLVVIVFWPVTVALHFAGKGAE